MREVGERQCIEPVGQGTTQLHDLLDGLIRLRPELGSLADELIFLLQGGNPTQSNDEEGSPSS